jgi:hypothetical protein
MCLPDKDLSSGIHTKEKDVKGPFLIERPLQSATQTVRYRSKRFSCFSTIGGASVSVVFMGPLNNSSRIIDQSSKKVAARTWPNRLPHGLERCHKIFKLPDAKRIG